MRHGKKVNHLGRTSAHRQALLSNLASSLILNKRISTTVAKAKALRKYAQSPDKQTFQRRMGGYLQRRGFSFDVIRPVIDGLWLELREAADRAELAEPDDEL